MGSSQVAGVVLAAGLGRRMGGPKASLVLDGTRLVDRAVAVLRSAGCSPVYAVVGAGVAVDDAAVVVNADPARGQRSSLSLAVEAVGSVEAFALLLVDTPGVTAAGVAAVCSAWQPGRIAIGTYAGRRGHPVVMAPSLWRAAIELAGPDEGAKAWLRARPELVDEVPVDGDPVDLDSPADVDAWRDRAR